MRLLALAGGLILTVWTAGAQNVPAPNKIDPHLELRLHAGELAHGIPVGFTFEIVNVSKHDIRVPKPIVDCGGQYTGFIWLRLSFKPLNSTARGLPGFGCAADMLHWRSILQRAQEWKVLHPGESVSQTIPKEELHYEGSEAGTYEFWADYTPPAVEPDEQEKLRKAGIAFPSTPLTTRHLLFTRKP